MGNNCCKFEETENLNIPIKTYIQRHHCSPSAEEFHNYKITARKNNFLIIIVIGLRTPIHRENIKRLEHNHGNRPGVVIYK